MIRGPRKAVTLFGVFIRDSPKNGNVFWGGFTNPRWVFASPQGEKISATRV